MFGTPGSVPRISLKQPVDAGNRVLRATKSALTATANNQRVAVAPQRSSTSGVSGNSFGTNASDAAQ